MSEYKTFRQIGDLSLYIYIDSENHKSETSQLHNAHQVRAHVVLVCPIESTGHVTGHPSKKQSNKLIHKHLQNPTQYL